MRALTRRIEEALERAGIEGIVQQTHSRHLVEATDLEGAVHAVSRVFGITSLSVVTPASAKLPELEPAAADYAKTHWPAGARSFAVRARRTGDHPFTSQQAGAAIGSAVWNAMKARGVDVRVDLDRPDWALHVEVRNKQAYLHHDRVPGPGGLPLGSQGRVVVWLTGGDSGVAAYLMMRRGAQIVPFYLPQVDDRLKARIAPDAREAHVAQRVHAVLREWGAPKRLHAMHLDAGTMKDVDEGGQSSVPLARFAIRCGLDLVKRTRAHALVTAETREVPWVARLPEVHQGGDVPTLRPLLGLDRKTIDHYRALVGLPQQSGAALMVPGAREED